MEAANDSLDFAQRLALRAAAVEAALDSILSANPADGEIDRPTRLLQAMRHGVLNGGKRLRPFLLIECATLFDADPDAALRVAAALECVHCYSLIHDDLPSMDDDDLRRGQPTVHRAFDEAHAILAGDSLLTLAFDIVSDDFTADPATALDPARKIEIIRLLARAAGLGGMAGGQALDLLAETSIPDEAGIIRLQAMKTGALLRFACEAGAVIGGASGEERERMAEYGSAIGLAFQIADDLLDLTSDSKTMGKRTGKDAARGKATLPSLHGEAWARGQLKGLVAQAEDLLHTFGPKAQVLKDAAHFIAGRRN